MFECTLEFTCNDTVLTEHQQDTGQGFRLHFKEQKNIYIIVQNVIIKYINFICTAAVLNVLTSTC